MQGKRKKMKEHDQVYLKVFKVEVEPENVIIVNYIGNKEDMKKEFIESIKKNSTIWDDTRLAREEKL